MTKDGGGHKQAVGCRTKVKTGCVTCRIRKVKCDENKPFCKKCINTGRSCDGYESPFRLFTVQRVGNARAGPENSGCGLQTCRPSIAEVTSEDIERLNHYFSTKTMFDVRLHCDKEARQVLQAGLTDRSVGYAISSLRALREDLESSGDSPASVVQQTQDYNYGLQQYGSAMGTLASSLSSLGPSGLKSALLCCQVFISIEQVRKDYAAMTQHIIRGLRIMHEYRARPTLIRSAKLISAHHDQLPLLDVFVIKIFAAPCKLTELPVGFIMNDSTKSLHQRELESRDLRTIAPDMRKKLKTIAASVLAFLDKVSRIASVENALQLIAEKAALLESLESWLIEVGGVGTDVAPPSAEPLSMSFMRLFRRILKIVLISSLDTSPDLDAELGAENDRLQDFANVVNERVQVYLTRACGGTSSD